MTLEQFERRIVIRADNLPGGVNRIVAKAVVAVDQALVSATPVDTGLARSNWRVTIGAPAEAVGPIRTAADALAEARAVASQRKTEETVYLTNNVEYIEALNNGSSPQAPAGFVQLAIEEGVAAVNASVIDTSRGGLV